MILFVVICAVMVAIALAFVLPPLLSGDESKLPNESKEANVSVYRDQLTELEADLRNGIIAQDQYQQDRDSIDIRCSGDRIGALPASWQSAFKAAGSARTAARIAGSGRFSAELPNDAAEHRSKRRCACEAA